jgi:hypothetical protein
MQVIGFVEPDTLLAASVCELAVHWDQSPPLLKELE